MPEGVNSPDSSDLHEQDAEHPMAEEMATGLAGAMARSLGERPMAPGTTVLSANLARVERTFDPFTITTAMRDMSLDQLTENFQGFRRVGQSAWLGMAITVGLAEQALAGLVAPTQVHRQLAMRFEYHWTRIRRMALIYRDIIAPRIASQGENASFPLPEITYYEVAVQASRSTDRPALALLEEAEDAKAAESSYSVARFREDVLPPRAVAGDPDSLTSMVSRVAPLLAELAELRDDVFDTWLERSTPEMVSLLVGPALARLMAMKTEADEQVRAANQARQRAAGA